MEIIYRAFDGKEFDTVTECAAYEEQNRKLKMWFKDGETNLTDKAYVVKLDDENATRAFIDKCNHEDSCHDGIEFDEYTADTGLFAWDMYRDEYFAIDDDTLEALIHCLKDEHLI